ncbi:2-hydroxy-6-oxohepta-2,4-dienoate hydrolase [Helicobacter mustelae]|uniref:alpha/beta fold hydrolase n=1 Tax=Helicobacter mustelae TaxID=217 RepID=UPI000E029BCE|nr:alpha/beta hydrolase [Helicobacter mustelae]STP12356.1 2-hydroxy-6-oxohepta-2,4-dienoate hydrolase [Helicobacter mustelae]
MAQRIISYQGHDFPIAYDFIHHQSEQNIAFLHGWGSNKEIMKLAFERYFPQYNHCYIDLPGFGRSPNEQTLNTQDYAEIMQRFFHALDITPQLVFGHSFGGKVATLLPYPIILLSSAGILEKKPLKVRLKILLAKLCKSLYLNTSFMRSKDAKNLNQGMYNTFKNVVNEDFTPHFANFEQKAVIFWGKQDSATSLSSGEKISKLIKNSRFYALEGDHYFFLKQGDMIEKLYFKE